MTWKEISFSQYKDILELYKDTEIDDTQRVVEICEILFGIDLLKQPLKDYGRYISQLDFLKKKIPTEPVLDNYVVNGRKYRLITKVDDINVAMFNDFTTIATDGFTLEKYPEIMSCFFIPDGKEYGEGYSIQTVREDIEDLPITAVNSIANFWLGLFRKYIRLMNLSLLRKTLKMPRTERKKLRKEIMTMQKMLDGDFSL